MNRLSRLTLPELRLGLEHRLACGLVAALLLICSAVPAYATTPIESALPDVVWRSEGARAQQSLRRGDLRQAEASLKVALAAADVSSGSLALNAEESAQLDASTKKTQFVSKAQLNRQLLRILRDKRDYAGLFEYAERGRARQFVDLLTDSELALTDQGKTNYQIRAIDSKIRAVRLQRALELSQQGQLNVQLNLQLNELMQQRDVVVQDLASKNTEWAAAYAVIYSPLQKVQAALGEGVSLIYAFDTSSTADIEYLHITSQQVTAHRIANGQKRLMQQIMGFTDAVALGDVAGQLRALNQMSQLLKTDTWAATKAIYVVPSRTLHSVPWSGLKTSTWVSTLSNGSWLLRNKPAATPNEAHRVLGDPEYFGQLAPLPGSRGEATQIANLYSTQAVLGADASQQALRADNNKAWSVLHLATHGMYNKAEPLKSALFFSDGKGGSSRLTAAELLNKPVRARLVVLSACESGIGQIQADNDVLGLQRSFFISGTHSVLSSLWPVSDVATSQLMTEFHRSNAVDGAGPAFAKAVVKAKQEGFAPAVYAAFVLNGYVAP
ncbi:MAG: CHAT domain-containing protein [Limnobacter sp.]|nr:CHAT domain-containing protein [Limnobacter sp.]